MALNLHKIAGNALAIVNDWQEMIFTQISSKYEAGNRDPIITETTVTLKGKLQPANDQEIQQLGFNLTDYQYFKIYITGTPTQLDTIRQLGCDTFICNNKKYKISGNRPWDDGHWRKAYCYLIDIIPTDEDDNGSSELTGNRE